MLKLILTISYPNSITKEDVRFEFLQYSEEMVSVISNSLIKAKYTGPVPIDSKTTFTFAGNSLSELSRESTSFFEDAVQLFLNNMFALSSVKINDVRVDEKKLLLDEWVGNTLEITAVLVGEYKPPPALDFGAYIDEIFEESGIFFIGGIKENKAFKGVVEMNTESVTQHYILTTMKSAKSMDPFNIFHMKEFSIPLYILLGIFAIVGIIYMISELRNREGKTVRIFGMKEMMDDDPRRNSWTTWGTDSKHSKTSVKSVKLRSEMRIHTVRNLNADPENPDSRRGSWTTLGSIRSQLSSASAKNLQLTSDRRVSSSPNLKSDGENSVISSISSKSKTLGKSTRNFIKKNTEGETSFLNLKAHDGNLRPINPGSVLGVKWDESLNDADNSVISSISSKSKTLGSSTRSTRSIRAFSTNNIGRENRSSHSKALGENSGYTNSGPIWGSSRYKNTSVSVRWDDSGDNTGDENDEGEMESLPVRSLRTSWQSTSERTITTKNSSKKFVRMSTM